MFLAKNIAKDSGKQIKENIDKHAFPHSFKIDGLVWYEDFAPLGKTPKLMPKWQGTAKVTELHDTNAKIQLSSGKTKVLNVMQLKKIYTPAPSDEQNIQSENYPFDFNSQPKMSGPITRAMKSLIQHKNAA